MIQLPEKPEKHRCLRKANTSLTWVALFVLLIMLSLTGHVMARVNSDWQLTVMPQGYLQLYEGTSQRDYTTNAGFSVRADYLEQTSVWAAYQYTWMSLSASAELGEHMVHVGGQYNQYLDGLPGKLGYRFDVHSGDATLRYRLSNPPGNIGGGMGGMGGGGGGASVEESTDISVWQALLSFSNYSKTLYLDLAHAYSVYEGVAETKVRQWSPAVALGWNDSYDWLRLRLYDIELDRENAFFGESRYAASELKYTHWYRVANAEVAHQRWISIAVLGGERPLAVDPDTSVVYSTADTQTAALSLSSQWRLVDPVLLTALVNYSQYENEAASDEYSSLLFYLNVQMQW